jgi:uncharacterized protein (TIGR03066 family)
MKRFLSTLASCLVVAAVPAAADDGIKLDGIQFKLVEAKKDDKIDKAKLVGSWKPQKLADELKKVPLGGANGIWEFDDDGSVKTTIKLGKIADNIPELDFSLVGKYELDGNKLTITLAPDPEGNVKIQGFEEIIYKTSITKLTDKEFQTKDEKGNVCKFTKKTKNSPS